MKIEGSNCREIVDKVVDMAHCFYIHYSFPVYFKNVFEGHIASRHMNSRPRADVLYVDAEDITPEMTQRFEFEIDT